VRGVGEVDDMGKDPCDLRNIGFSPPGLLEAGGSVA
jgi:hypothetical protein